MCDAAVCMETYFLANVLNRFKTRKMCDKAVRKEHFSLLFVPDWFVTQQQIKYLRDDNDGSYNNKFINWYDGYKKGKAQKAKIKDELMPIGWHPSRWWDWCLPNDEKQETEKLFLTI